jgi:hypothetical protein
MDIAAFYVTGGVLAAWAVLVSFFGIARSGFPGSRNSERAVAAISVVLVAATIATGILAGLAEEEVLEQEDHEAEAALVLSR